MIQPLISNLAKVTPLCPVFGDCGGCLYQDVSYPDELAIKEKKLKLLLQEKMNIQDDLFEPIVASLKEYHYRNRLDLKLIRNKQKEILMGFSPEGRKRLIELDVCYIARKEIADFLPELKRQASDRLTDKYKQANLVVRTGDDGRIFWGGIGRRSLQLKEEDYLWTTINGRKIFYSLDTFFQANLSILPKLFARLSQFDFWNEKPTLYDLYGGVGLFGIGLIDKVKKVILIEDSVLSLRVARYNAAYCGFNNFEIVAGKVEDELPKILENQEEGLKVAFVDPPRAGLSDQALSLLREEKRIDYLLYLSCNPEALGRDLQELVNGKWKIIKIMPFDFFPKTRHLETLVLLSH